MIEFGYSKVSDKFFRKHEDIRDIFEKNIISIHNGDNNIDVKLLKGYKDLLRMRISDYRVIYRVLKDEIIIVNIIHAGSRGEVYKKI